MKAVGLNGRPAKFHFLLFQVNRLLVFSVDAYFDISFFKMFDGPFTLDKYLLFPTKTRGHNVSTFQGTAVFQGQSYLKTITTLIFAATLSMTKVQLLFTISRTGNRVFILGCSSDKSVKLCVSNQPNHELCSGTDSVFHPSPECYIALAKV